MRMKEVCKLTGLTDKAVRVYINNELISPDYTEGYNGRRNYSFDDNDVEVLKRISLLRSYDFSLSEIKAMLYGDANIEELLENHIDEIKNVSNQSTRILNRLLDASVKNCKSSDELCLVLEEAEEVEENKANLNDDFDIKKLLKPYIKKAKARLPKFIALSLLAIVIGVLIIVLITIACTALFMKL